MSEGIFESQVRWQSDLAGSRQSAALSRAGLLEQQQLVGRAQREPESAVDAPPQSSEARGHYAAVRSFAAGGGFPEHKQTPAISNVEPARPRLSIL